VLDNYFKFTNDKMEWKDTRIVFEISADGSGSAFTRLKFTHQGLVPEYECFKICKDAWTHYIQGSLKDLIEKGKGQPTPGDGKEGTTEATSQEEQNKGEEQNQQSTAAAKSICHSLVIEAPVETVYKAITTQEGLAGWWTPETAAKPETGSILRFTF